MGLFPRKHLLGISDRAIGLTAPQIPERHGARWLGQERHIRIELVA